MSLAAQRERKNPVDTSRGLSSLLTVSLESALAARMASEAWRVEPMVNVAEILQEEFVLLTVSSYHFRMLILLHFSANNHALRYVAEALKLPPESITPNGCYDYLAEIGNQFCGEIKRIVGATYSHLGMSTPMRLSSSSLPFVHDLKTNVASHVRANRDGKDIFVGSIFLCVDDGFDFQIDMDLAMSQQVQTSALELF